MRQRFNSLRAAAVIGTACLSMSLAGRVQAQMDEVIVTTGFRPETLSGSIGSTTVIDAAIVDARGAEHLEAVLGTAANVTMSGGSARGRFVQVRGIGDLEQFVDPKHYPSVGISVDGIDLGGIANAAMLFDVEQIEVLRGPQGTRYGASALAGQVNIRTTVPTETFDAYLDAGIGDYGSGSLGFAAGGELADNLAGRIAVQHYQGDGYRQNAYLARDDTNGYRESTLRAKLRFTPRDAASLDVTAIHFDGDDGYDAFAFDNSRTTLSDRPGRDALGLSALGLKGSWLLYSGGTVEASLSWLDSEHDYSFDEDWAYVGRCDGTICDPGDEFSNTDRYLRERNDVSLDLRWLGPDRARDDRTLNFVLGMYVQDRSESLLREYYVPFTSDYLADRAAVYGQLEIGLSDRLELTLGYRFEQFEDHYGDSAAFGSVTDDEFHSGEIALSFRATDRNTFYGIVSRGHKPGGVNTEASSVYGLLEPRFQGFLDSRVVFASERLTNHEIGIKSSLIDGRLGLRAALFRMTRDRAQIESWFLQYVPFLWVGLLDNADGHNEGAELEFDFTVSDVWRLRASLGLLDTAVESLTTFDLDLDSFVARDGIDQSRSPSWQMSIGSEWEIGSAWRLVVDVDSSDSERYGYYHDGMIDRATVVNAALSRRLGPTELTLWTRNLLDEDYAVHGLYFGNDPRDAYLPERYLQLGEPRLLGLSVRISF